MRLRLKALIISDTDAIVGAEIVPAFMAPLHFGQGKRSQIFATAIMIDPVVCRVSQADAENAAGVERFGCFEAHAVFAVIEGH